MNIKDVLRNAGVTLLTFSLVVAMALMAKHGASAKRKNDKEGDVRPDYNVENVTKSAYEDESDRHAYYYNIESTAWDGFFDEQEDVIKVLDGDIEYFTDSFN